MYQFVPLEAMFLPVFLQVRSLVAQFGPALQAHLSLAFQDLQVYTQRGQSGSLGAAEACCDPEHHTELFRVLLKSLEEAAPCRYLLQEALMQRSPTLAIMAACQQVTRPDTSHLQNSSSISCFMTDAQLTGGGASALPVRVVVDLRR